MKKIKDIKVIILSLVLLVFSIGYFVIVTRVSYAFDENYDVEKANNIREEVITKCAIAYGNANVESFNKEGILYTTVQTLIDSGYVTPNEEGNIIDPKDITKTLNSKKIRIKKDNDKIIAEIYN